MGAATSKEIVMKATWLRTALAGAVMVQGVWSAGCSNGEASADRAKKGDDSAGGETGGGSGGDGAKAEGGPRAGDQVLARWAGSSFYEGKVNAVAGDKATIAWTDGSSPSEVALGDVVLRDPPPGAGAPAAGDAVLARWSSSWYLAEVTAARGDAVDVRWERDGTTGEVAVKDLRALGNAEAKRLRAGAPAAAPAAAAPAPAPAASAAASAPAAASGYEPRKGDHVLAEWTAGHWYPGTVKSVEPDGAASVAWADGSSPSSLGRGHFAPLAAKGKATPPAAGSKVLVKPEGSDTAAWDAGEAVAVHGANVDVKVDGATRTVPAHEVLEMK
jgi:hypothetical protein